jgi:serine/threonine protein kinase
MPYFLTDKVGSGAFGSVYKGIRRKDEKIIALKIIDLEESQDDIATINREIMALVNGKTCKQLTQYYGSHVNGTFLWIAMEFVDGGSIHDLVKKSGTAGLQESVIAIIVREVIDGEWCKYSSSSVLPLQVRTRIRRNQSVHFIMETAKHSILTHKLTRAHKQG